MEIGYIKLRDGSWGIRAQGVEGQLTVGQTVEVKTKAGEQKRETIAEIKWFGKDDRSGQHVALCSIVPKAREAKPGRHATGSARYYGGGRGKCKTGGNCSSFGSGKSCGASDCDGY